MRRPKKCTEQLPVPNDEQFAALFKKIAAKPHLSLRWVAGVMGVVPKELRGWLDGTAFPSDAEKRRMAWLFVPIG